MARAHEDEMDDDAKAELACEAGNAGRKSFATGGGAAGVAGVAGVTGSKQ